ncbi:hypothetical protein LUZ60_009153 [Juncus effusus]|nr:hypothetical protein LUZ60_009153 [Juncus effusus]
MGSLGSIIPFDNGFKPLDIDELRNQLHHTIDFITDYYKSIESHPVLPNVRPGYIHQLLPSTPSVDSTPFQVVLHELHKAVLPGLTNWASPNFFAYFPATLSSAAIAGDLLASALNPVGFTWQAAPAATELEALAVDWLGSLLCLPPTFHNGTTNGSTGSGYGIILPTTSESMLVTLVSARDMALSRASIHDISRLVTYASDQTHSTFTRVCRIAGFHPTNIRSIKTRPEFEFSLEPSVLLEAMQDDLAKNLIPTYICATVGSTSSNACDPVDAIADVANMYGVWVHIDAAYAGSACVCPEFRHYLNGVERVNSLSLSPHKWLLTGLDCTCLWVRSRSEVTSSLEMKPEYLRNGPSESGEVTDLKDFQLGVGRRFRALRLWMVLRVYGAANLQEHIRSDVAMAKDFEGLVRSDRRFEVMAPRKFALVCFRIRARGNMMEKDVAEENERLMNLVNGTGRVYITHTVVGGKFMLRFAVGSTLSEERHVRSAWELIRKACDEMQSMEEKDDVK